MDREKALRIILTVTGLSFSACAPSSEIPRDLPTVDKTLLVSTKLNEMTREANRAKLAEEDRVRASEEQKRLAQEQEKTASDKIIEQAKEAEYQRLESILGKLKIRETLQSIKNDIWGEGTINTTSYETNYGGARVHAQKLMLTGDSIPRVVVRGHGLNLRMDLIPTGPGLNLEVEIYPTDLTQKPMVYVKGDMIDESYLWIKNQDNLKLLMDTRGTPRGIDYFYSWGSSSNKNAPIDPDSEDALGKFYGLVLDNLTGVKPGTVFPSDVRRWSNRSIDLVPELRTKGVLGRTDLYDWESAVRNRPKIASILSSIWDITY